MILVCLSILIFLCNNIRYLLVLKSTLQRRVYSEGEFSLLPSLFFSLFLSSFYRQLSVLLVTIIIFLLSVSNLKNSFWFIFPLKKTM